MTRLNPVSRKDLIKKLRQKGFTGPFTGGNHEFMIRETVRIILPNPHRGDIGSDLLIRLLRQAGIPKEEWE